MVDVFDWRGFILEVWLGARGRLHWRGVAGYARRARRAMGDLSSKAPTWVAYPDARTGGRTAMEEQRFGGLMGMLGSNPRCTREGP